MSKFQQQATKNVLKNLSYPRKKFTRDNLWNLTTNNRKKINKKMYLKYV